MKIMKQEELVAKYEGAVVIYALQRKNKMTNKEKAFDWAVALLSPLPGIVEEADQVADMGSDILEAIKNDLFEPFKCSDTSRVSKDGSGLGLAITRRIVELHKGKIYVDTGISGYTKGFVIELNT